MKSLVDKVREKKEAVAKASSSVTREQGRSMSKTGMRSFEKGWDKGWGKYGK